MSRFCRINLNIVQNLSFCSQITVQKRVAKHATNSNISNNLSIKN